MAFVLIAVVVVLLIAVAMGLRIVQEYERGIVFRLGRVRSEIKRPGLNVIIPVIDRMVKVNMQVVTMASPHRRASPATTSRCASTRSSTSASSTR